ncbi:hypothetical protein [Streptomyces sp. YIM S03343]
MNSEPVRPTAAAKPAHLLRQLDELDELNEPPVGRVLSAGHLVADRRDH